MLVLAFINQTKPNRSYDHRTKVCCWHYLDAWILWKQKHSANSTTTEHRYRSWKPNQPVGALMMKRKKTQMTDMNQHKHNHQHHR